MRPFSGARRSPRAPEGIATEPGERVIVWALADDGVPVAATTLALRIGATRLPWDRVAKATWDDEASELAVVASPSPAEPAERLTLVLPDGERLAEAVRLEVTSNIVVAQRIQSPEHGGAWVTARRVPGADDVRWTVVFDPDVDPREPGRRAWADHHVAALRDATGV